MAYIPIARTIPQYEDANGSPYSGAVLKAYSSGTTTPISFATDDTGSVLAATITLNASGYPEVSGNMVIPHLEEAYKLSLYPDQASADADSGAIWTIDDIELTYITAEGAELTDVGDGTVRTSAINVGQVQDSDFLYLGTTAGSANAYTISMTPEITAYSANMHIWCKIHTANTTTTPYLQLSGISSPASNAVIKKLDASKSEIAVEAGDLIAGGIYQFQRNTANDAWIVLNPSKPYLDLVNATVATDSLSGIVELATLAEVNTGTDTAKAVTPDTLKDSDLTALQLISTTTISNDSTVEFTDLDQYSSYKFILHNVVPATDAVKFYARVSTDNGSTYKTGASDYRWAVNCLTDAGENIVDYDAADDAMLLSGFDAGFEMQNDSETGWTGEIIITNPTNGSKEFFMHFMGCYQNSGASRFTHIDGGNNYQSNTAVNALQFFFSSGNLSSGTIKLYGIK